MSATFGRLCDEAAACRACPGMAGRTAVTSGWPGVRRPRILFVAEAPGRLGADRTRVPLLGDASGDVFRRLIAAAGLDPAECQVTNAVLCNPRGAGGGNRPPLTSEIRACNDYLRRRIAILDPPVVAALGGVALRALEMIEPHGCALAAHAGTTVAWHGRRLAVLYHPGPRVLAAARPFDAQVGDWVRALREEP